MYDIDSAEIEIGPVTTVDSENRNFLETAIESSSAPGRRFKEIGLVAVFDRKRTRPTIESESLTLRSQVYLTVCYVFGRYQPLTPKFFYVYGDQRRWQLEEVDPVSQQRTGVLHTLTDADDWQPIWEKLGLIDMRRKLTQWLSARSVK